MKFIATTALVALFASAAAIAQPAPTDWPGFLGAQRNGHSADIGLLKSWPEKGPALVWKFDKLGPGWSSVAVAAGSIYTTGNSGAKQVLICLDLDGKEKWRVEQGPKSDHNKYDGARATPTVDGDHVYVTNAGGLVTCHKTADGSIVWKRDMKADMGGKVGGWQYAESVLIAGDLAVVTPGGRNPVVALNKLTGEEVWKSDKPADADYCSAITITRDGATVIVQGTRGGLIVLDAKSGKEIYRNAFAAGNTANCPTPAYEDGMLFWGVGYGKGAICLKVNYSDGKWSFEEAWTSKEINCHPGNYVVADGKIYGKGRGGLVCVDLKNGKTLWSERGAATGQACWADGMVYSFADNGATATLVEPSEKAGKVVGKMKVDGQGASWAHPVVTGGRLYLRYDTNLYCFDVKAK